MSWGHSDQKKCPSIPIKWVCVTEDSILRFISSLSSFSAFDIKIASNLETKIATGFKAGTSIILITFWFILGTLFSENNGLYDGREITGRGLSCNRAVSALPPPKNPKSGKAYFR